MSEYCVKGFRQATINGIEYNADIKKWINIDFSSVDYSIQIPEKDKNGWTKPYYILKPTSTAFLHELTDIYPEDEYDIEIRTHCFRRDPYPCIYIDIYNKDGKSTGYSLDSVILSDRDYNYLRGILARELPQYEWRTIEQHLKKEFLKVLDYETDNLISEVSGTMIDKMLAERYAELKREGYVDYKYDDVFDMGREIVENALRMYMDKVVN